MKGQWQACEGLFLVQAVWGGGGGGLQRKGQTTSLWNRIAVSVHVYMRLHNGKEQTKQVHD